MKCHEIYFLRVKKDDLVFSDKSTSSCSLKNSTILYHEHCNIGDEKARCL